MPKHSAIEYYAADETTFFEDAGDGTGDKKHADDESKDVLETFFEMVDEKTEEEVEVIDWEAIAREHEAEVVQQQTREFLEELIYKIVNEAEYRSEEEILAESLDKRRLLAIFAEKCLEYETETAYNHLLDQKITKHLLRKKLTSQISPSKLDAASKPKYFAALWRLEKHLTREAATRKKYETIRNELLQELKECEEKQKAEIQSFETLVKLKLSGNDLEHLNHRILPHVAEIREFRKRISSTRFRLILLEDTHAKLKIKLAELENLGNDLTVTDYYNLHNQNQGLQKKLEGMHLQLVMLYSDDLRSFILFLVERDRDLRKLHYRLQRHLHILGHYGETKDRLYQVIGMQRYQLEEAKYHREYLRRRLQKLTLRRIRTRQQIKEMSLNAGLLDKPFLMHDYDNTIQFLKEEREIVARLRVTVATLQSKINVLEKRLSNNLSIKGKASLK
ncbi:hypothetical protein DOY81_012017 [Sarcophaga bullata]|nr:hypothetical protein DOY81_012017 [Sarcophaga bullata]